MDWDSYYSKKILWQRLSARRNSAGASSPPSTMLQFSRQNNFKLLLSMSEQLQFSRLPCGGSCVQCKLFAIISAYNFAPVFCTAIATSSMPSLFKSETAVMPIVLKQRPNDITIFTIDAICSVAK